MRKIPRSNIFAILAVGLFIGFQGGPAAVQDFSLSPGPVAIGIPHTDQVQDFSFASGPLIVDIPLHQIPTISRLNGKIFRQQSFTLFADSRETDTKRIEATTDHKDVIETVRDEQHFFVDSNFLDFRHFRW